MPTAHFPSLQMTQNMLNIVEPLRGSEERDHTTLPSVRVVEPDRPFRNVRNVREVLRGCRDFIWWADMHFEKRGLEPLADEADTSRISTIRVLMVTRPKFERICDVHGAVVALHAGSVAAEEGGLPWCYAMVLWRIFMNVPALSLLAQLPLM
jgi:hypothetical protein